MKEDKKKKFRDIHGSNSQETGKLLLSSYQPQSILTRLCSRNGGKRNNRNKFGK